MSNEEVSKYLRKIGAKGGKTAAQRMSKEQRQARSRKGLEARWGKKKGGRK